MIATSGFLTALEGPTSKGKGRDPLSQIPGSAAVQSSWMNAEFWGYYKSVTTRKNWYSLRHDWLIVVQQHL